MDLYHHSSSPFTQWITANDLLHEDFVVIDIGCQGGAHPRWVFLRDRLVFHGFDPIREVIEALTRQNVPGRTYHECALGAEDGEGEFYVNNDAFSSSFFGPRMGSELYGSPDIKRGARTVTIRQLDTLFAAGELPPADYIKLDCEGYEPEVLRGARQYLRSSGPICVTSESAFNVGPTYPHSHFQAVNEILAEHRLLVFDLNIVRSARPAYRSALAAHPWAEPDPLNGEVPHLDVGAPGTIDVVFCRDLVAEVNEPGQYGFLGVPPGRPSVDQLIKAMINFELHGLMDCAYEIATQFRPLLETRLDVEKAMRVLLTRAPHARNTADVVNCLTMIAKLKEQVSSSRSVSTGSYVESQQPSPDHRRPIANYRGWELASELGHRILRRLGVERP